MTFSDYEGFGVDVKAKAKGEQKFELEDSLAAVYYGF